jgi:hypothetical protein
LCTKSLQQVDHDHAVPSAGSANTCYQLPLVTWGERFRSVLTSHLISTDSHIKIWGSKIVPCNALLFQLLCHATGVNDNERIWGRDRCIFGNAIPGYAREREWIIRRPSPVTGFSA